jgi:hypothetical protein
MNIVKPPIEDSPLQGEVTNAWSPDSHKTLSGFADHAGIDVDSLFSPRQGKWHPWCGKRVKFIFDELGWGTIKEVQIHPLGHFSFDVYFDDTVPLVLPKGDQFICLVANNRLYSNYMRLKAHELFGLVCEVDNE